MLIVKVTPRRIFFIDEYWILTPVIGGLYYYVIGPKLIKYLIRKTEEEKKRKREEELKKFWRIRIRQIKIQLMLNSLQKRGGDGEIDAEIYRKTAETMAKLFEKLLEIRHEPFPKCVIRKGLSFLEDETVREYISNYFAHKQVQNVIYITKSALCHLIQQNGLLLPGIWMLVVPYPLKGNYVRVTELYHPVCASMTLIGLFTAVLGFTGPAHLISVTSLTTLKVIGLAISGVFLTLDSTNSSSPPTRAIDTTVEKPPFKSRYRDVKDVVVVNLGEAELPFSPGPSNALTKGQCWIPGQPLQDNTCSVFAQLEKDPGSYSYSAFNIPYDKVVNMQDTTGLRSLYSDVCEVEPREFCNGVSPTPPPTHLRGAGAAAPQNVPIADTLANEEGLPSLDDFIKFMME